MGRHVNRSFVLFLIPKFSLDRQNHSDFCKCYYCRCFINLNRELSKWNFYDLRKDHDKWFIIFHQKDYHEITVFPVFV